MKKYISAVLVLCLIFTLVGCSKGKKDEPDVTETTEVETTQAPKERFITLGYYEEKSLNPFITESPANRKITTLIYDSLFITDESYAALPLIAESSQRDGNSITVKIKEGLTFSSGAALSAQDVVYSFNFAKQSAFYSTRLQNIALASAYNGDVVFTLAEADAFCESVLTFPIVQSGTAENDFPTGSGRYAVQHDPQGRFLKANENNSRGEALKTEKIRLTPITSSNNELYLLQSGDLGYFFDDLSDGEYTKISANMIQTPMNSMVFMAFNSNSASLSDKAVKDAVELAVDPQEICNTVYGGMARYSPLPFNPDWFVLETFTYEHTPSSLVAAQQVLEDAGYIYAYETNKHRSKDFEFLELRIIVNEESKKRKECAELIKSTLDSLGIDVTLSVLSYEDYITALKEGNYDIYVGEVRLSPDMNLTCFFSETGEVSYGIDSQSTVAASYRDFRAGTADISTFSQVYFSAKPFIPIGFRDGMSYFSREFTYEGTVTEYEPFLNASSWEIVREAAGTQ